jgi:hypothetical protein
MSDPFQMIFAKVPPPKPLARLLEELKEFRPPPKSEELVRAEAVAREARRLRAEAQRNVDGLYAQWRAADQSSSVTKPGQSRLNAAEALLAQRHREVGLAKEAVERESLPWRRAYFIALDRAAEPVRRELHALTGELTAATTLLGTLATQAGQLNVGSNWLSRNAPSIIESLVRVTRYLEIDRRGSL